MPKSFGKIQGSILVYEGKSYKIRYVVEGALIVNTDKLFGKFGDEFPIDYIK